jgi:hypothetical protein
MPIIPLKQTVTVYAPGHNDPWNPQPDPEPVTYRCRVEEGFRVVTDDQGREVTSSARILFDKYPSFPPAARIKYTDEYGITKVYRPINGGPKRMLSGKPVLTVVYVK